MKPAIVAADEFAGRKETIVSRVYGRLRIVDPDDARVAEPRQLLFQEPIAAARVEYRTPTLESTDNSEKRPVSAIFGGSVQIVPALLLAVPDFGRIVPFVAAVEEVPKDPIRQLE